MEDQGALLHNKLPKINIEPNRIMKEVILSMQKKHLTKKSIALFDADEKTDEGSRDDFVITNADLRERAGYTSKLDNEILEIVDDLGYRVSRKPFKDRT
jgi:hypothetical protein